MQNMTNGPEGEERVAAQRWWVERLAQRWPGIDVIREDRQTNHGMKTPGAQTVVFHRLANWGQMPGATRAGAAVLSRVGRAGLLMARNVYGIELPAETTVGRRVKLAHQSGIVIHRDAVIGNDVVIRQNVTIGLRGDVDGDQAAHVPQLADGVDVGAGAVLVGPIHIGEKAAIGANAVVTHDVSDHGRAVAPRTVIQDANSVPQ
ncbi:serine O-acetyltransferase [Luteococcus japonicus]|uniref:Serine O-acetyltransferase n=1 Tax=Luteococcus japonicus TaxID=33984 RepID=A0A3N1ZRT1_9ACTN|nr:serine acetyltransferase [Luteococcus japonicus]ROR53585.1 serine O-acetyltransferase [Luteococcus japonicus]